MPNTLAGAPAGDTPDPGTGAPAKTPAEATDPAGDAPEWAPAPGAEHWNYAYLRHALGRLGLPEGEFGERDGWQLGPDGWDVMIRHVQAGSIWRPRGSRARETWEAAFRSYEAAAEAAGFAAVRRKQHGIVVHVPVPAELRVTARARRVGPIDSFTTSVTFDGWDGIGGTVTLHSTGGGAACYEVRDHLGQAVNAAQGDRRAATESLAHWYGLPTPDEYVDEGRAQEDAAPATPADVPNPTAEK